MLCYVVDLQQNMWSQLFMILMWIRILGADGYSSSFHKDSWDIIGVDITNAVLEFFHNFLLQANYLEK